MLLLIFASLTSIRTDKSYQCPLTRCKDKENRMVKVLGCLVEDRRDEIAALAQKYLDLFKECLERMKGGCFCEEYKNECGCTCDQPYPILIKPLNIKRNECKDVTESDFTRLRESPEFEKDLQNIELLMNESSRCRPPPSSRKRLPSGKSDRANQPMESLRTETYKVCTCDSNECDPRKQPVNPNGGGNGQEAATNDDKNTTKSSARIQCIEKAFVIMQIVSITISFIFDN